MSADPIEVSPCIAETERLVLRRLEGDDAAFMLGLLNDAAFLRFIGDRGVRTLDEARAYIVNGPMASYRRHGFGFWCVVLRETGAAIGISGLARRDTLGDVDVGFAFLPEYRSQGYALESAQAVMRLAREVYGLRRIVAITAPANAASAHLLEKIGLRFERMIRVAGEREEIRLFAWDA